jgi:hypothetical protein
MLVSQALARVQRPSKPTPLKNPKRSNPGRFTSDGPTRMVNCYTEFAGEEAKNPWPVYAADGLDLFSEATGTGGCRGLFATESRLIWVAGRLINWSDLSGGANTIGGLADDGPVYFSANRADPQEIAVTTSGGLKFTLTFSGSTATLTEIDDTDLQTPNSNDFLDGYTLQGIRNGRVYYSELDSATEYGANSYYEAEGNPDKLQRIFVHKRTALSVGDETIEAHANTGQDSNNPFERIPGIFFQFGTRSPATVRSLGERVVLVANTNKVVAITLAGGFTILSTPAVERAIEALTEAQKAVMEAFVYERAGHRFYVLSAEGFTWAYDELVSEIAGVPVWGERKSQGKERWIASYYAKFGGMHIVGDFENPRLYRINPNTYSEPGSDLIMSWRFPIHAWPNSVRLSDLFVDMIPGVGLNVGDTDNADPQLMAAFSTDGGNNFPLRMSRSIGKIGEYGKRIKFSKIGLSGEDGFVVELSCSAAVARGCMGIATNASSVKRGK